MVDLQEQVWWPLLIAPAYTFNHFHLIIKPRHDNGALNQEERSVKISQGKVVFEKVEVLVGASPWPSEYKDGHCGKELQLLVMRILKDVQRSSFWLFVFVCKLKVVYFWFSLLGCQSWETADLMINKHSEISELIYSDIEFVITHTMFSAGHSRVFTFFLSQFVYSQA